VVKPLKKERWNDLLDQFVKTFPILDDLIAWDTDPLALELASGEPDDFGYKHWRPKRCDTDQSDIEKLRAHFPVRLPPLYELLLCSYRWAEVEEITRDHFLSKALASAGYIQFGKVGGGGYDPICFDTRSRKKTQDCRVVKVDHEEILCHDRVRVLCELESSFEELVLQTIAKAERVSAAAKERESI